MAVISFDLSATWRRPKTRRWPEDQAETMWMGPLPAPRSKERRKLLPSTEDVAQLVV